MKQAAILFVIAVILSILSCAINQPDPKFAQEGKDYELSWSANDDDSTFGLKLTSNSKTPLCISVDDWPDRMGQVSGGAGRASLTAVNFSAPSADTNFGYCVGKLCTIVIAPYSTINGVINYKEFGDPDKIKSLHDRQLSYGISPFFCPR
jgi:hypothetical protein